MVIDTSAIIAVIFKEPEAEDFIAKISSTPARLISAASWLEASTVLTRRTKLGDDRDLQTFLSTGSFEIVPFDQNQASIAREAYVRFGQGSGHRARLNFGDCFAYALAKQLDTALLFKGGDFGHTDVVAA